MKTSVFVPFFIWSRMALRGFNHKEKSQNLYQKNLLNFINHSPCGRFDLHNRFQIRKLIFRCHLRPLSK
jgi:hypothetical protein